MFKSCIVIIAAAAISIFGCAGEPAPELPGDTQLAAACDSLTNQFMTELKGELMAALQDGGPAEAVGVCRVTAPDIADEYSQTPGWEIKRISSRTRNADNTPSEFEATLLAKLDAADAPPVLYQWAPGGDGDSTFYYLKAIRVAQPCLMCHGDRTTFSEELAQTLEEEYPDDQATGYQPGDLRGAFVVTVNYPEGAAALMPASPSR